MFYREIFPQIVDASARLFSAQKVAFSLQRSRGRSGEASVRSMPHTRIRCVGRSSFLVQIKGVV